MLEIIQEYPTDPAEVMDIAREADILNVILYHLAPPPENWLAEFFFLYGLEGVPVVAEDGMSFRLSAGGTGVEISTIADWE